MRCASSTGCRTGTCNTQVPISIFWVTAAMTLIKTIGSRVGRPRPNESVTHSPAKPRSSTPRAKRAKRSRVRPVSPGTARITLTTCTLIAGGLLSVRVIWLSVSRARAFVSSWWNLPPWRLDVEQAGGVVAEDGAALGVVEALAALDKPDRVDLAHVGRVVGAHQHMIGAVL